MPTTERVDAGVNFQRFFDVISGTVRPRSRPTEALGGCIRATEGDNKKFGVVVQTWSDGSRYEGESVNGLKQGEGVFAWANGESYEGSFYKDYRHGSGTYTWPEGSRFHGKFYRNRKEGYGIQHFPDGTTFQGLYHADERFGPGVLMYLDGRQDVGLWHRGRLLRLCTRDPRAFSLRPHLEYYACTPPVTSHQPGSEPSSGGPAKSAFSPCSGLFVPSPQNEAYSTDSDHLALPLHLQRELDRCFFSGRDGDPNIDPAAFESLPLQLQMQAHIHRYRFEAEEQDWDVAAVTSGNREHFGPQGPLELVSERLIQEAFCGNRQSVYRILMEGRGHPDVGDATVHTALIAATVNFHTDVIHLLLDSGADVNKLNGEGMSALAVCGFLYYLYDSPHKTLAETPSQGPCPHSQEGNVVENCQSEETNPADQSDQVNYSNCPDNYDPSPENLQPLMQSIPVLDGDVSRLRAKWSTMALLLSRGADPNASSVPMPVLLLAIKARDVKAVRRLLECGARTDVPLQPEGLYPLHIAAGLLGPEGPKITELLLHALADPNVQALDKSTVEPQSLCSSSCSTPLAQNYTPLPDEGGRTPLHVACQRDAEYARARDVVSLLLSHKANTNLLWRGHSPLSLAIASGNNLAVDELLTWGADPNLTLTHQVGSALCAVANISYNCRQPPQERVKLLEKLVKAGANILMPVTYGEGRKTTMGTAVDYAHYIFQQDRCIAYTPYHALSTREREVYNAWRHLLAQMGKLLQQAAVQAERQRMEAELRLSIPSISPSDKFLYVGAGATLPQAKPSGAINPDYQEATPPLEPRKPLFEYCYQCGRSAGVALEACSRCRQVFYCGKACKIKAWSDRHKDECIRLPGKARDRKFSAEKTGTQQGEVPQQGSTRAPARIQMTPWTSGEEPTDSWELEENYSFN